jgi:3-oxo-5-alpha-steroid 4-dehydrogenase 3
MCPSGTMVQPDPVSLNLRSGTSGRTTRQCRARRDTSRPPKLFMGPGVISWTMELRSIDPALVCQAFFIGGAIAALAGCAVPSLRNTLFSYGLRTLAPISQASKAASQPSSRLDSLIKFAAQLQVPHTWFTHYYAASVAFSVFWAHQLLIEGSAFQALRSLSSNDHKPSMSVHQVYVSWALMAFQGCRRLYESIEYLKPSEARMPFAIYAGGMLIYFFMGISVWIEGMR